MLQRALNLVRYRLGEFLLRGTLQRVLVMVGLVVGCAALGGLCIEALDEGGFRDTPDAVWWAFLRLSDPGYLGDDVGAARRVVSVMLTVAGYVLFMGAMVAIMTQWLHQTVRKLESGLTPIAARGHVVIAGWTDRTVSILREMFRTESRSRGLLGRSGRRLLAVVLAEDASPELHQNLRERTGEYWRERQIILREGEPIYLNHLLRADFVNAGAILLPGDPYQEEGNAESDVRIIKAIASIGRHLPPPSDDDPPPFLVAELFDSRREAVARSMYAGPMEIVCSDRLMGGLLAQGLRYPDLAGAVRDVLFSAEGARVSVLATPPSALGMRFLELAARVRGLVLLGMVRDGAAVVCPDPDCCVAEGDQLIVFGKGDSVRVDGSVGAALGRVRARVPPVRSVARVLVLGWTKRVPSLLQGLAEQLGGTREVVALSNVPIAGRKRDLARLTGEFPEVQHFVEDYTISAVLAEHDPHAFDAVLLVGSDRLESGSESDARTLCGVAALRAVLPAGEGPRILAELMDAENAPLVAGLSVEYFVTPMVVGRVLAQVAMAPPLRAVFDDAFGGGGAELVVVSMSEYVQGTVEAAELLRAILSAGHLPLGALEPGGGMTPLERADLSTCHQVVVMYRSPERGSSPPQDPSA